VEEKVIRVNLDRMKQAYESSRENTRKVAHAERACHAA
jgi:hypothetical protein